MGGAREAQVHGLSGDLFNNNCIVCIMGMGRAQEGVLNFLWLAEKFFLKLFFLSLFYSLAEYAIA